MTRKHDPLVRLLVRLLRAAGYQVATDGPGTWEPRWDRPLLDRDGNQRRDDEGNLLWEHARLDLRLEGGPEEPTTYGDVVVSQARAESWVREGAATDGAVALAAARRKRARYPPDRVPGAKLVAFSVETGGRWDSGSLNFLRRAAGRASERRRARRRWGDRARRRCSPAGWASCRVRSRRPTWPACARRALGAPAPAARPAGAGAGEEEPAGEDDWLNEAVEELLRHAAACAAAELP